jgi:hypothetical protein
VAERLPAEEQRRVLGEALDAARGIEDAWRRAEALAKVAERLPAEEALVIARGIDGWRRAEALAKVAERLVEGQVSDLLMHHLIETVRVLAMRKRPDCVGDFAAIIPIINTLGEDTAVSSFGRSLASIGRWWP